MFTALVGLSVFILGTGCFVLRQSLKLRSGSIDFIAWHVGFVSVYLGGGGLWSLLTMSDDSFNWALDYYEIAPLGVCLSALAWIILLVTLYFCRRAMPCVVDLGTIQRLLTNDASQRVGLLLCASILTLGLLIGYTTGDLGYMGQRVGDQASEFRVNPIFDLVISLFPAVAALSARRLFEQRIYLSSATIGIALLALAVPLGRRGLIAVVIAAVILSLCTNSHITQHRLFSAGLLALVGWLGLVFFFNIRQVEEAKPDRSLESRTDLISVIPEALALTFGKPDAATLENRALRRENESVRPFFTLGFFVYCAQGYGLTLGNTGLLSLSGLAVAIPNVFFPDKDAFLRDYQEEERFIERDFGIPLTLDESPTLPASGLINFGLPGVAIQIVLVSAIVFLCIKILMWIISTPFSVLGVTHLLIVLQLVESSSANMFVTLRLVMILGLVGWVWAVCTRGLSKNQRAQQHP